MKIDNSQYNRSKAQSILEYVIVLAAILTAILANTFGLQRGLRNSLDVTQNVVTNDVMTRVTPPQSVQGEKYYTPTQTDTNDPKWGGTDTYGGPSYTGGYNYDEWVKNNPDSAYNAPASGTTVPDSLVVVPVTVGGSGQK